MNKKIVLTVLPVFMLLASCSAQPNKVEKDIFVEDTLAHNELFGGEEVVGEQLKLDRTYREADPSLKKPLVGVQYKAEGDGKYSIRYVAAIHALDVQAVWHRGLCLESGSEQLVFGTVESTVAYTALGSGSTGADNVPDITVPADAGEDYNYFVVYTVRNIPSSEVNSYLFAYLTLKKGASEVSSDARISKVSGGNSFTLDLADGERSTYFIQGRINGSDSAFYNINDDGGSDNYIQESNVPLIPEDNFGFFKYETEGREHFQYFGSYGGGTACHSNISSSDYEKVCDTGTYDIFLSKKEGTVNKVYLDCTATSRRIYLDNGKWIEDTTPHRYALNVFHDDVDNSKDIHVWYNFTLLSGVVYYVDVPVATFATYDSGIIFVRFGAEAANDWANKWNQTQDFGLPSTSALRKCHIYDWDYNGVMEAF